MKSISLEQYQSICRMAYGIHRNKMDELLLKLSTQWHQQCVHYEECWIDYFTTIFLTHRNDQMESRVILWESCPGGTPFPHPNYAFSNLDNQLHYHRDRFLIKSSKCFGIEWKNVHGVPKTKRILLGELAERNCFIMDLLPTHGMVMTKIRPKILKLGQKDELLLALRDIFHKRSKWLESQLGKYSICYHHDLPICKFLKSIYCKILDTEPTKIQCEYSCCMKKYK